MDTWCIISREHRAWFIYRHPLLCYKRWNNRRSIQKMLPFLATLVVALGSCLFLENHCYLNDANRVTCLLQGDTQPNEPRLDSIIGQTLGVEASGQNGCPTMKLSQSQLLEIYLLPCEGMLKNVEGIVSNILEEQGKLQSPLVTSIPSSGCNQSVFSIKNALLDDDGQEPMETMGPAMSWIMA